MKKNSGFGVVGVILIVVAVGLVGFIGWRLYDASQNKQGNSTDTSSQIQQSSSASQAQQSDKQTDPNEGYVVIKEWSVRFKPVDGLEDIEYFKPSGLEGDQFTFTTSAMASAAEECGPKSGNIVLGLITRNQEEIPVNGSVLAKIGDRYYQYRGPESTCGAGNDIELKASSSLAQSLKSLEAAK